MITYTYAMTEFPEGKLNAVTLRDTILACEAITAAFSGINIEGADVVQLNFRAELTEAGEEALGQIVRSHQWTPRPVEIDLVQLSKTQEDSIPMVALAPRVGSEFVIGTHNFADKCTWFGDSVRVTAETLVLDGLVATSGHTYWVDMVSGRMHNQEHWRGHVDHAYAVHVYVDGVEKTQCPPFVFDSQGDYWVEYDKGEVHFLAPVTGVVTADYSYATTSTFYVKPLPGYLLRIEDAEADFSQDTVLTRGFGYIVVGFVDVFAPQYVRGAVDGGTVLAMQDAPPAAPVTGDRYLVAAGASGAWAGWDGGIATYTDGTWSATSPQLEMCVLVESMGMYLTFRGGTWSPTPFESGTKVPIQESFYHRVHQIIVEARGSLPSVRAIGASADHLALTDMAEFRRVSRGMKYDVQAVPFNYATTRDLRSDAGLELHVVTTDHQAAQGELLTVTFYCTSVVLEA